MPASSLYARRFSLLFLLLSVPLLARADALDGAMLFVELLAAVAGVALLGVVLTLLAYRRPHSNVLRVLNYIGVGLSLLAGILWEKLFSSSALNSVFLGFNPFLSLSVPLAIWLGGVTWARQEEKPLRQLVWVAVAVFGAQQLLNPLVQRLVWSAVSRAEYTSGGISWLAWAISLLVSFACWWLVLGQVQQRWQLGWQALRPRLLAPAVEAGISLAYSFALLLLTLGDDKIGRAHV